LTNCSSLSGVKEENKY